jgi:hypothetical protein
LSYSAYNRWWKAKLRPEDDVEEKIGLIPASYVEEVGISARVG